MPDTLTHSAVDTVFLQYSIYTALRMLHFVISCSLAPFMLNRPRQLEPLGPSPLFPFPFPWGASRTMKEHIPEPQICWEMRAALTPPKAAATREVLCALVLPLSDAGRRWMRRERDAVDSNSLSLSLSPRPMSSRHPIGLTALGRGHPFKLYQCYCLTY